MIARSAYIARIRQALDRSPVVMLVGPRQVGKTTLAREILPADSPSFFDLERPAVAESFTQPMTVLQNLSGLVVCDEAQRQPGLFPVLRVLVDRVGNTSRFLLLGSASPALSRQASESLAGRIEIIEVRGFDQSEADPEAVDALWLRGGFPRSFLAASDADSLAWRDNFISTFLERDLAMLGFAIAPPSLRRFWTMLAHYHGQVWNASEIAASLGVSPTTARNYLDALEQTYMIRRLQPWYENLGKRLIKSPKIYMRDSGLFHALLGITHSRDLLTHPKLGASWEGFALEEVLSAFRPRDPAFYGVHSGAELDLFFLFEGQRIGIEFKRQDAPRMTRSMRTALADLKLDRLFVVYPGDQPYRIEDRAECVPLTGIAGLAASLRARS